MVKVRLCVAQLALWLLTNCCLNYSGAKEGTFVSSFEYRRSVVSREMII